MINLKHLNGAQKKAVLKVFDLLENHKYDTDGLESFLQKNKWRRSYGSFKICYIKHGLVIKFSPFNFGKKECAREYEQWLAAPKGIRKYLARTIAYKHNVLIQEAVTECSDPYNCAIQKGIMQKYGHVLADASHNHGHKKNQLKFFDWIYYRFPIYISTNKWLPGSKRRIV